MYNVSRDENFPSNLSQARTFLSDIEVILGQLVISNWGETIFDYLPNLMYIGGFEGNSSLATDVLDSLIINDNNPVNIPLSNVSLNQIHFPRLVEISGLDIFLINNPALCYVGELEYYKTSSNQTVRYSTAGIARKDYSDCGTFCEIIDNNILFKLHVNSYTDVSIKKISIESDHVKLYKCLVVINCKFQLLF